MYTHAEHMSFADLEAGGGRAVAALLRRAAQGVKVLRLGGMSAEICRDACWEKLHTGNWAEVDMSFEYLQMCCLTP